MKSSIWVIFGIAVMLTACTMTRVVNHPYDASLAQQFRAGITTIGDVERVYGVPARTLNNPQNGHTELVYAYVVATATSPFGAGDVNHQGLIFVFGADGRMMYYRTSGGESTVR